MRLTQHHQDRIFQLKRLRRRRGRNVGVIDHGMADFLALLPHWPATSRPAPKAGSSTRRVTRDSDHNGVRVTARATGAGVEAGDWKAGPWLYKKR